jgi:2-polyprenyl-6-hydroxyphenyl methylase/3-demethylubiquinone-9 3-methyltransferase
MMNVDTAEVGRFEALSHRFWDPKGEFKPLHILNPVRAGFVAERVSLRDARVLDVGCGGGLLCEAFARAGAQVTGVDLAPGMVEVARLHAAEQNLAIDYRVCDANTITETYDVVTSMEMLEHVPNPAAMVATLARLTRPGGSMFVSTINRNLKSFLMAIVGAEYLLRLIPRGTHEYQKLIQPAELSQWARAAGLRLQEVAGLQFDPLTERCALSRDPSVNYLMYFKREQLSQ